MLRNCFGLLSLFLVVGATSSGAVDPLLLSLAPPSAEMIAGVDVESSRNSDFGRFLMSSLTNNEQAIQRFAADTGFDIRRDLKSLILASSSGTADKSRRAFVLLGRGAFDESRIRAVAVAKGSVVQPYEGTDMFLPAKGRGNAFAFVGPDTIALGDQASVQQVISNRTQASRIDTQLQQLITAASADNDIWFASRVPLSTFAQRLQEGTQSSFRGSQVLQAVQTATGSVRFGDPIRITLNACSQSEKDASALADVIRFGADLLQ